MQDNNYNNSKFINYNIAGTVQPEKPKKKKRKKIIFIILLLILLLIAGYLFYINKIEKESNKKSNDNYEEYDPNYKIEESNSNVTSNVTSDITSNITSNVITSNSNKTSNTPSKVAVSSISFSSSATGINVGGSKKLSVIIKPTNATNKGVTWSSSNTSVVSVDQNGKITGKKVGSATITATAKDGGKKAICKVTVTANIVVVQSIKLNVSTLNMGKGGITTLSATITPSNATNQAITWSSSNSNIVSVDQNGNLKGVGVGTATITATTKDGNKTASTKITVSAPGVSSISMSASSSTIYIGKYLYPTITYNPSDATGKSVTWSSSNSSIATVNSYGKVTGIAEGDVTITATTPNGRKAIKTFYVRHDPSTFQVRLIRTTSKNPKTGEILGYYYTYIISPLTSSSYGKYSTSYIYYNGKKITGSLSSSSATVYNTNIKSVTIYSSNGKGITCTPIYELN